VRVSFVCALQNQFVTNAAGKKTMRLTIPFYEGDGYLHRGLSPFSVAMPVRSALPKAGPAKSETLAEPVTQVELMQQAREARSTYLAGVLGRLIRGSSE
jgi:hypothetical protein